MDQTRHDPISSHATTTTTTSSTQQQQQNVHLHMHHVCTCQGIYQSYYPPLGYRTPLITYATATTPQTIARPYVQQYQQYATLPAMHLPTCMSASPYNAMTAAPPPLQSASSQQSSETGSYAVVTARRDRGDIQQQQQDDDRREQRAEAPPPGYEMGHVTPPAKELLLTDTNMSDPQICIDNFVKFLERGCLTAEQIAFRNRNRPCFRNIQNLCIRTRSEILKPCTTLSNIHSQGIPWVTKDFIYAFIRLTNCWHILRGYWEHRDGSALGKVEAELTPDFRASYVKWEKSTVDLATELTRIFYNLDTNLNSVNTAAHLVPSQVNVSKSATTNDLTNNNNSSTKKPESNNNKIPESIISSTNISNNTIRGILHLPTPATAETVDQANQTYTKLYESDDNSSVYMKPGSYHVPKKPDGIDEASLPTGVELPPNKNTPRVIEFLDTAQNITKGLEAANDKYWAKLRTKAPTNNKDVTSPDSLLITETMYNVQDWLSSNSFIDYPEGSNNSNSTTNLLPTFADVFSVVPPKEHEVPVRPAITLLQRDDNIRKKITIDNNQDNINKKISTVTAANGCVEISSCTYRRKSINNNYELNCVGLTKGTKQRLENLMDELKTTELAGIIIDYVMECPNLNTISKHLEQDIYSCVNEVVKDLNLMINYISQHLQKFGCSKDKLKIFSLKLETALIMYFPNCDFTEF